MINAEEEKANRAVEISRRSPEHHQDVHISRADPQSGEGVAIKRPSDDKLDRRGQNPVKIIQVQTVERVHMFEIKHVNQHVVDNDRRGQNEGQQHAPAGFFNLLSFFLFLFFNRRAGFVGSDQVVTKLIDKFINRRQSDFGLIKLNLHLLGAVTGRDTFDARLFAHQFVN